VKEYELFLPLNYNDGSSIEPEQFMRIRERLLEQFGDFTFFPQANIGFWKSGLLTFRDNVVFYKIVTKDVRQARRFFRRFKEELKQELRQEEIFILEKDVTVL